MSRSSSDGVPEARSSSRVVGHSLRRGIRDGDHASWNHLAARHHRALCRLAQRLLPAHEDPEDAAGAAWLRAYRAADTYDARRRAYPWLAQICRRTCRNACRRERRPSSEVALREVPAPTSRSPLGSDERGFVLEMVRALPPRHRQVVTLHFFFGASVSELAELLGMRPNSVRQSLGRALGRLRALLRARNAPPAGALRE